VRVKKLTANAAAILAGFRCKSTPYKTILKLLPKLTAEQRAELHKLTAGLFVI
jgi:hypothetical protein